MTAKQTKAERKLQDRSACRAENRTRRVKMMQAQDPIRASVRLQTPLGAKKTCSPGGFRTSFRKTAGDLGNVGSKSGNMTKEPKLLRQKYNPGIE